jgi:hypothetical protein
MNETSVPPANASAGGAAGPFKPYQQCGGKGGDCQVADGAGGAGCVDGAWGACAPDGAGSYFGCERKNEWYWQCKPGTAPSPPPAPPGEVQACSKAVAQLLCRHCAACCTAAAGDVPWRGLFPHVPLYAAEAVALLHELSSSSTCTSPQ